MRTIKKVICIFGTRPEAIKMAPVIKVLEESTKLKVITVVTAQHREMLDQVLRLFNIEPQYDLNIMETNQSITDITIRVLKGFEAILLKEQPDLVLVHGDTTTTLAGSLAAFYRQIPIGHIEAGLRTYHKYAPYPEEMNRKLTGCLADLHFAPTLTAKEALLKEGVNSEIITVTGNTVIDALLQTIKRDFYFKSALLNGIDYQTRKVILVTAHRRENLGEPLGDIFSAIREIIDRNEDLEVIFPVHPNPKVRELAEEILGDSERIHLIGPLDYEPFVNLMNRCYLILTDSGGIQEEAPALGKPVLVLRETTERPEAVEAGIVKLIGTSKDHLIRETQLLLTDHQEYEKMAKAVNPYGDGKAAERILNGILNYLGLAEATVEESVHGL
ncbi:MAG: UDP-N-acetylglucosamine 2-epimerase (non-hydrolyzing) [Firmicutes bacterium]|nr:UDP-N-acetylglucosamine 2-epimerase (non-hydrolyzing) [Bacillota bacterium]